MVEAIHKELKRNNNKLSEDFINSIKNHPHNTVTHVHPTRNTRVCVVTLYTGHELVGYAQVLDENNDDELIGQKVAYDNAIKQLWTLCGSIAKCML